MLNVQIIIIITKSISYNTTLILKYVLIHTYIYVYLKINSHPRCYILETLHELTPKSAGQWPTQKPYKNCFLF